MTLADHPDLPLPPPKLYIPDEGKYLWNWFAQINGMFSRSSGGVVKPIPPSEFLAWAQLSGLIVNVAEYDILREMDAVYCVHMTEEAQKAQIRRREKQEQEAKSKGGGIRSFFGRGRRK